MPILLRRRLGYFSISHLFDRLRIYLFPKIMSFISGRISFVLSKYSDVIALFMVVAICIGSLIPRENLGQSAGGHVQHVLSYALLAFFAVWGRRGPSRTCGAVFVVLAFGVLIEYLQPSTGRIFDPNDIYSNMIGVAMGCIGCLFLKKLILRFDRSHSNSFGQRREESQNRQ